MVHALCWTVEDVQGWLQSMGMEADIVELFATYKVDGHALLQLDAQRLRDMGLISAIRSGRRWFRTCGGPGDHPAKILIPGCGRIGIGGLRINYVENVEKCV